MTSVTSPQQTSRGGADIPAPRDGQVVRLLVLGADADAQELRDQASAAGFELAQRYSARVSHVAYGSGVNPEDTKYHRIREAGLALLPVQACASQLGLGEGETSSAGGVAVEAAAEVELGMVVARIEVGSGAGAARAGADTAAAGMTVAADAAAVAAGAAAVAGERPVDVEDVAEVEDLGDLGDAGADADAAEGSAAAGLVPGFDRFDEELDGELGQSVGDAYAPLETLGELGPRVAAAVDEEGPADEAERSGDEAGPGDGEVAELPLAAVVIGADPWTGEAATLATATATATATTTTLTTTPPTDLEAADATDTEAVAAAEYAAQSVDAAAGASGDAAAAPARVSAGYVLLSLAWALIPFVTFGLLTPVVFGYAAFRLRSRMLGVIALGYTVAVVLSFALSAARPYGTSPTGAAGAVLTLALASAWIGGTVHALSLRVKVFAR